MTMDPTCWVIHIINSKSKIISNSKDVSENVTLCSFHSKYTCRKWFVLRDRPTCGSFPFSQMKITFWDKIKGLSCSSEQEEHTLRINNIVLFLWFVHLSLRFEIHLEMRQKPKTKSHRISPRKQKSSWTYDNLFLNNFWRTLVLSLDHWYLFFWTLKCQVFTFAYMWVVEYYVMDKTRWWGDN